MHWKSRCVRVSFYSSRNTVNYLLIDYCYYFQEYYKQFKFQQITSKESLITLSPSILRNNKMPK